MQLSELIAMLEEIAEAHPNEDPVVRIATQPSWPMESEIHRVCSSDPDEDGDDGAAVYIGAGESRNYLPSGSARAMGWQ